MAHNQQFPAKTPIIKFKEQDFYSLWDHCLNRGLLFEDETFPAETYSIGLQLLKGKNLSNLSWMRPKSLPGGPPVFILEGASRFDIQQGEAGDCWFLAALGASTQSPLYLQKILMDQSFSYQYAGIFHFRFWRCGQWVEVVIDDRLPVLNNEYLFVKPRNKREFWPCLLEKAYAKFHGSYANLHYGYLPDALVDLTGGVVTNISLHSSSPDLMTLVKTAAEAGSLMTCGTLAGPINESVRMANGLVSRHAYTVTGAEQIEYRRSWEYLIRLWNPWGKTEWRGPWSDRSPEWQETHDQRKSQLYEEKDNGEFWMSCQDFRDNFFGLFICNQVPISLDHGCTLHERWSQMTFKDHLIPGNTEGYQKGMQYTFSVPDSMENNNVIMSFNIGPQNLKAKDRTFPVKYEVFKVDYQVWSPPLPSVVIAMPLPTPLTSMCLSLFGGCQFSLAMSCNRHKLRTSKQVNNTGNISAVFIGGACDQTRDGREKRWSRMEPQSMSSDCSLLAGPGTVLQTSQRACRAVLRDSEGPGRWGGLSQWLGPIDIGGFSPTFHLLQFQHFQDRLPSTFFSEFRIAEKGIVSETTCNLTECFSLSPGTYVVVVSEGREAVEFLLRIFLKMPDSDRNLDGSLSLTALQASLPGNGSQQSIFYKYAQQRLDIDATQLQSLLNREFLRGPPGDAFSLDECRSIVALMDLKVNGRLDQEEFSRLWSRLVHCQSVFQNSPKNAGIFLSSDLWKAIKDTDFLAGISITSELLDLMKLRYSDSTGRVSFPSLVCFLMRLEAMAKAFWNLSKDGKGLYLTETEWMNLVMYN
ncbi:calpain-13 [Oryx dammah]|uniref:calpain-13 n=1 Tax=Oryx dammah TaxID=59534 RepID=UPI001A9B3A39|nr:calpain-13 [Oryx dammah]